MLLSQKSFFLQCRHIKLSSILCNVYGNARQFTMLASKAMLNACSLAMWVTREDLFLRNSSLQSIQTGWQWKWPSSWREKWKHSHHQQRHSQAAWFEAEQYFESTATTVTLRKPGETTAKAMLYVSSNETDKKRIVQIWLQSVSP